MREITEYFFDLNEPVTRGKLNTFFRVGDLLPASFIQKMQYEGKEIPSIKEEWDRGPHGYRILYTPADVIQAAKREKFKINESRFVTEERERENRLAQIREEQKQNQERLEKLHEVALEVLPDSLHSKGLLNEQEIVAAAQNHIVPSGVYFLCDTSNVVYVGQSINIPARIRQHETDGYKEFTSWAYVECPPHALNFLETLYILSLKPKYNRGKDGRLYAPMSWDTLLQNNWTRNARTGFTEKDNAGL
jgi:hypothetical protein